MSKNIKKSNINSMQRQQQITRFRQEHYQGLVPHPDLIRQFEELYPGAAEFFFNEVEKQTNHRIEMEKKVIISNIAGEKRGSVFAFTITMTAMIGGFFLTLKGFKVEGLITAIGGIAALVGVFIYGKKQSSKDLAKKREG